MAVSAHAPDQEWQGEPAQAVVDADVRAEIWTCYCRWPSRRTAAPLFCSARCLLSFATDVLCTPTRLARSKSEDGGSDRCRLPTELCPLASPRAAASATASTSCFASICVRASFQTLMLFLVRNGVFSRLPLWIHAETFDTCQHRSHRGPQRSKSRSMTLTTQLKDSATLAERRRSPKSGSKKPASAMSAAVRRSHDRKKRTYAKKPPRATARGVRKRVGNQNSHHGRMSSGMPREDHKTRPKQVEFRCMPPYHELELDLAFARTGHELVFCHAASCNLLACVRNPTFHSQTWRELPDR